MNILHLESIEVFQVQGAELNIGMAIEYVLIE